MREENIMMDKDHWNEFFKSGVNRLWAFTFTGIINSWVFLFILDLKIHNFYKIFIVIHNLFFTLIYLMIGTHLIDLGIRNKRKSLKSTILYVFVISAFFCWLTTLVKMAHI